MSCKNEKGYYDESMKVYTSKGLVDISSISKGDEVVVHDRSFGCVEKADSISGDFECVCINGIIRCAPYSQLYCVSESSVRDFLKSKDPGLCKWVKAESVIGEHLIDHVGRRVGKVFSVERTRCSRLFSLSVRGYRSFNLFGFIVR